MPKLEQTYICPRCFESRFEDRRGAIKKGSNISATDFASVESNV